MASKSLERVLSSLTSLITYLILSTELVAKVRNKNETNKKKQKKYIEA
jgi:hypothetical protein